jgi:hypothetical protein
MALPTLFLQYLYTSPLRRPLKLLLASGFWWDGYVCVIGSRRFVRFSTFFITDQVILGAVLGAVLGRRCSLIFWIHVSDYIASMIQDIRSPSSCRYPIVTAL